MSSVLVRPGTPSCADFESDISAFVDGELARLDHERVVTHLDACSSCRRFAQMLKGLVAVHRDAEGVERLIDEIDPERQFAEIARKLLAENQSKLAGICYELGKSYILAGSGRLGAILLRRRASSIPRLKARGRSLNLQVSKLAANAGVKSSLSLPRKRGLFEDPLAVGNRALDTARSYLEAALKIDPKHLEARLYLGHYFRLVGRTDIARQQFRRVLTLAPPGEARLMALVKLGLTYSSERRYQKALECFLAVWAALGKRGDRQLRLSTLMNLAIFNAKIERYEQSTHYFGLLLRHFGRDVAQVRKLLAEQHGFKDLLRTRTVFHQDLRKRYPLLFAS
jgi:tetratricopeptide (TPR) repeat protein